MGEGSVNAPSFDDFVAARASRLLRVAFLLTRDWQSAEDLLQTALMKAWSAWSRVNDEPEPYVRRIIVNAYTSSWRRRWRGELAHAVVPEPSTLPGQVDEVDEVGERDVVWQALGRLPPRQRAVVVLRYFEDLPEAHVADLLGITVGTVKSQTAKALRQLRVDPTLQPADERS
jgi:RNA polymerase sigma-70 factor (sigma-E family)